MSENDPANITQILKSLQHFLSTYENPLWSKSASVEDIKLTFKLGNFIEKTIHTFKIKDFLTQFLILLEVWGRKHNLKSYNEEFFILANDHLLAKLFKCPNIKESTLDIGVRVYTSLYSKERFKECLKILILTSNSLKTIADFVNNSVSDLSFIENNIILSKWSEYSKLGLGDNLKAEIETYLSLYNVEEKLPRLISILAMTGMSSNEEISVRNLVLECLFKKMLDRSLLSKTFWLTLFQKVNLLDVSLTCNNHHTFLEHLLNFIEYIGGMMQKHGSDNLLEWTSNPKFSFCHEINYFQLVVLLKLICHEKDIETIVLGRLELAREYSNAELWDQIINDISE